MSDLKSFIDNTQKTLITYESALAFSKVKENQFKFSEELENIKGRLIKLFNEFLDREFYKPSMEELFIPWFQFTSEVIKSIQKDWDILLNQETIIQNNFIEWFLRVYANAGWVSTGYVDGKGNEILSNYTFQENYGFKFNPNFDPRRRRKAEFSDSRARTLGQISLEIENLEKAEFSPPEQSIYNKLIAYVNSILLNYSKETKSIIIRLTNAPKGNYGNIQLRYKEFQNTILTFNNFSARAQSAILRALAGALENAGWGTNISLFINDKSLDNWSEARFINNTSSGKVVSYIMINL